MTSKRLLSVIVIFGLLILLFQYRNTTDSVETIKIEESHLPSAQKLQDKLVSVPAVKSNNNLEQNDQKKVDDYQSIALNLLQKSLEEDGKSQYELVTLLSHCQAAIEIIDTPDLSVRDDVNILLSYPLSAKERTMLNQLILELDKCGSFHGGGFNQFLNGYGDESENSANNGYDYWLRKSLSNGYPSAGVILLGFQSHSVLQLSRNELERSVQMIEEIVKNPSKQEIKWINQVFLDSKYKSAPVLNIKYEQDISPEDALKYAINTNIVDCLKGKYINSKFKGLAFDCAENVQRYGRWYDPNYVKEIELEARKINDAWENGDFAGAGYNNLFIQIMSYKDNSDYSN